MNEFIELVRNGESLDILAEKVVEAGNSISAYAKFSMRKMPVNKLDGPFRMKIIEARKLGREVLRLNGYGLCGEPGRKLLEAQGLMPCNPLDPFYLRLIYPTPEVERSVWCLHTPIHLASGNFIFALEGLKTGPSLSVVPLWESEFIQAHWEFAVRELV